MVIKQYEEIFLGLKGFREVKIIRLIRNFATNPYKRTLYILKMQDKIFGLSDRKYIEKNFVLRCGYHPDLDNPKTLCEKLNWVKLNDRRPEYTDMVDKYKVKQFVAEKAGEKYVTPLLGVWDRFEDIDFDKLPDTFVLKCNHDGGPIVVKDKNQFDKKAAAATFRKKLKADYFRLSREWPYKNVQRKIIAEPFYDSLGKRDSVEYKLTCFNGKVKFTTVCIGIAHAAYDERNNDHFDRDWKRLDFSVNYKSSGKQIEKPHFMDEMIWVAEKLAEGIPYVRVDFYVIDGQIKFGEMTFFTWGGFMKFDPPQWDEILGSWMKLPGIDY